MAVTSKNLHSADRARAYSPAAPRRLNAVVYVITLVLAVLAVYAVVGLAMGKLHVVVDDLRYGRPRTTQLNGFVGHDEAAGQPTHLMAINLNRQVIIVELPGGDPAKARSIAGPYLFGADEDLTPVVLSLHDADRDGQVDLLLDVRRELLVYLNKDGVFRLPTAAEEAELNRGSP
jgi:hypothetical protein